VLSGEFRLKNSELRERTGGRTKSRVLPRAWERAFHVISFVRWRFYGVTHARVHRRSLSSELISFSSKRGKEIPRFLRYATPRRGNSEDLGGKRALGMRCEFFCTLVYGDCYINSKVLHVSGTRYVIASIAIFPLEMRDCTMRVLHILF